MPHRPIRPPWVSWVRYLQSRWDLDELAGEGEIVGILATYVGSGKGAALWGRNLRPSISRDHMGIYLAMPLKRDDTKSFKVIFQQR